MKDPVTSCSILGKTNKEVCQNAPCMFKDEGEDWPSCSLSDGVAGKVKTSQDHSVDCLTGFTTVTNPQRLMPVSCKSLIAKCDWHWSSPLGQSGEYRAMILIGS